jgi:hypothetical protein
MNIRQDLEADQAQYFQKNRLNGISAKDKVTFFSEEMPAGSSKPQRHPGRQKVLSP